MRLTGFPGSNVSPVDLPRFRNRAPNVGSVDLCSCSIGRKRFSDSDLDGDRVAREHRDASGRDEVLASLGDFVDQFADCLLLSGDNTPDAVILLLFSQDWTSVHETRE